MDTFYIPSNAKFISSFVPQISFSDSLSKNKMMSSSTLKPITCPPIPAVYQNGQKPQQKYVVSMSAVSSPSPDKKPENFQHHTGQVPKMEPFSRGKISRWMKEPSLIEKAENAIMDRCCTLEGEESYNCWEAFFEFENMKKESQAKCSDAHSPLDRMENLVRQSGGVKSLIENVQMVAKASKLHKGTQTQQQQKITAAPSSKTQSNELESLKRRPFPQPDGLPKTQQELEEEEKAMMPESSYTRMLRRKGGFPAWYTPHPDHETD